MQSSILVEDSPPPARSLAWFCWLLALAILLAGTPIFDAQRAEEARVLESAREMLGRPLHDWLVPHCNARIRPHKPPLAYWAAAASFHLFGVHDWAGRIPFALSSWLTLGLVYHLGRRAFNHRTAFFASATFFGSLIFLHYMFNAETDVLALFFVIAAAVSIWNGARSPRRLYAFGWYQLSGIAIGLAALAKGPQALFPILFLIALMISERRWRLGLDWLLSGAPVLAALVGLPWYIYIARDPAASAILRKELDDVAEGHGHARSFWAYPPMLFGSTAPWSAFLIMALVAAFGRSREDLRHRRTLLLWAGLMLLALSVTPQKQEHYLLPLVPPLMLLVGWAMDRALGGVDPLLTRAAAWVLAGMLIIGLIASAGPPILAPRFRGGPPLLIDWLAAVATFLASLAVLIAWRSRGLRAALPAACVSCAFAASLLRLAWYPTFDRLTYPQLASVVRERFGGAPLAFYDEENLPLCFYLGRTMRVYETEADLRAALAADPRLLVIHEQKSSERFSPPAGLREIDNARFLMGKRQITLYRASSEP